MNATTNIIPHSHDFNEDVNDFDIPQYFIDAQNMADEPIDTDEKKAKFVEIIKNLQEPLIHQIFSSSNHHDAAQILLDDSSIVFNKSYSIMKAIMFAKKKGLTEKLQFLSKRENSKVNHEIFNVYKDNKLGTLITSNYYDIYISIYNDLLKFLEKYHNVIDNQIRSSYWHDHKIKYPFDTIKVYMVISKSKCYSFNTFNISLVTPLNETYTGSSKFLENPYMCDKIDEDPSEIIHQEILVYHLAKYSIEYGGRIIKNVSMTNNHIKYIKCVKCRKVINDCETIPFSKKIHKSIPVDQEKCQECLTLEKIPIIPEDYYCDWNPTTNEKWYLSGNHFLFTPEEGYPAEILKTAQPVTISNFIIKNIVNPIGVEPEEEDSLQ